MVCLPTQYDYLRRLVLEQSANVIGPERNRLFDARLAPLARVCGAESLPQFVQQLRREPEGRLHHLVAEAMTINETSFFRDGTPFDAIRSEILPAAMACRREERRLRIWSAASSTGQEAYSVAMMIREDFPELAGWDVRILGSDLSAAVVEYARAGRYRRMEVKRGLSPRMLEKYLVRRGEVWEMAPQIRGMCEFRRMNLCAPLPALPEFDVILLRNVLIYFSAEGRSRLLREAHRLLAPQGALVLGNAEQTEDVAESFVPVLREGALYYRRAS